MSGRASSSASVTLRIYVRRRASGTATGLWLRQEVRGFQLICMGGFARRQGRKGMIGAAAGGERERKRGRDSGGGGALESRKPHVCSRVLYQLGRMRHLPCSIHLILSIRSTLAPDANVGSSAAPAIFSRFLHKCNKHRRRLASWVKTEMHEADSANQEADT